MIQIAKMIRTAAAALLLSAAMLLPVYAAPSNFGPGYTGWYQEGDAFWRYMKEGTEVLNDWEEIDGHWYYFGSSGTLLTGWQDLGDGTYYLSETETPEHPYGSCYIAEQTPDGSMVDEDGCKILQQTATTLNRPNPYGYSCVEVDVPNQTVYAYIGSELKLVTPCVTGNAQRHATPAGSYKIDMHMRDKILRGTNDNGTKYASHVDYWMRFTDTGIGLHDATWRSEFGGEIYKSGGSHGCVNLPYDAAQTLFGITYIGMPVIVHY